ncbi:MAG: alkaline phosphatase [Pseudomonadota bacterium]
MTASTTHRLALAGCCLLVSLGACTVQSVSDPSAMLKPATAKNVILFIGDGMGVSTVTAARIFDGQSKGLSGEEHELAFERFENLALAKTYNTNQQVPDSAGTATAILTGSKTRAGVINIGPDARRGSCAESKAQRLVPLSHTAKERGLSVGFVTTARLTHATPAVMYAHSPERGWEADSELPDNALAAGCRDIAAQLVDGADRWDVALGGGDRNFLGSEKGGVRAAADAELIATWLLAADDRRFVSTADRLASLTPGGPVLGLFSPSHLTYVAERTDTTTEPTLAQMTATAIDLLSANDDGYFLLVEGGRIDHGHHAGKPGYALVEAQAFNRAVEAALERIDLADTLVIVTADHSHVFTLGGYPTRGNPILGLVVNNDASGEPRSTPDLAGDGSPYTSVAYANGPGAVGTTPRPPPDTSIGAVAQALIPTQYVSSSGQAYLTETHAGEDVAVYATGPGAERVRGVLEQNRLYHVMRDAFGWR